jgi:hypothetical protein
MFLSYFLLHASGEIASFVSWNYSAEDQGSCTSFRVVGMLAHVPSHL